MHINVQSIRYYSEARSSSPFEVCSDKRGNVLRVNVILRRARVTIVATEKQQVLHILSV